MPELELSPVRDEIDRAVDGLRRMALKHPIATQAAFSALAAEGRRYALTESGEIWQRRLADSALLRRLWRVWEAASLSMMDEEPRGPLPSGYIDALFMAAGRDDLNELVAELANSVAGRAGSAFDDR